MNGPAIISESPLEAAPVVTDGDWPGVVRELVPAPDPADVFRRLSALPHCVFFDSALPAPHVGRYSFIAADPFYWMVANPDDASLLQPLSARMHRWQAPTLTDLPPFQGGAAGLFSYDLSRSLERLPTPRFDEFQISGMALGWFDVAVVFDHLLGKAWIISQGFPETEPLKRHRRAKARAADFRRRLETLDRSKTADSSNGHPRRLIPASQLSSQFPSGQLDGLTSNFTPDQYLAAARQVIDYIYAGDVFQVNLSQRLLHPANDDSVSLYLRLRDAIPRHSPAISTWAIFKS